MTWIDINIFLLSPLAEEVGRQKFAAQDICRELRDADEANLLDEEGSFFNFIEDLYPALFMCPSI
jgi:hypothetical protein